MRWRVRGISTRRVKRITTDGKSVGSREEMVGLPGVEPGTSRLSGARSNRLSYKPTRNALKKSFAFVCQLALLSIHAKKRFVKLILGLTHDALL